MRNIAMESLGCSKNLVDAEIMIGILAKRGFNYVTDLDEAEIIIVNTCGFIESAKKESIDTILEYAQLKETGRLKYLIATGCLAQRYPEELKAEIPELDAIVGTGSFEHIENVIKELNEREPVMDIGDINIDFDPRLPRFRTTPDHMAYLKIAEGCSNRCTYCIIPKLRGDFRSKKLEDIIEEARALADEGVKEVVVIAQDTTKYGLDNYNEYMLPRLLEELAAIKEFKWIRVMYMYPETVTEEMVDVIARHDNICSYFDIPIQHASDIILKLMNRKTNQAEIRGKIEMIRKKIPDACIRTTLITGFPGETQEDFDILVSFVNEMKFDRLGVFAYSREEDTPADKMPDHLSEEVKEERRDIIMLLQQGISEELNSEKVGKIYDVLIEELLDDYKGSLLYAGRTYMDMVEIDCEVLVDSEDELEIGDFVKVKIVDYEEYDLRGVVVNEG